MYIYFGTDKLCQVIKLFYLFDKITIIIGTRSIKELSNFAILIEDFDGFFLVLITANFYLLVEFADKLQRVFQVV
jgi:hypothetical protein